MHFFAGGGGLVPALGSRTVSHVSVAVLFCRLRTRTTPPDVRTEGGRIFGGSAEVRVDEWPVQGCAMDRNTTAMPRRLCSLGMRATVEPCATEPCAVSVCECKCCAGATCMLYAKCCHWRAVNDVVVGQRALCCCRGPGAPKMGCLVGLGGRHVLAARSSVRISHQWGE
jgi:hypothetical protein